MAGNFVRVAVAALGGREEEGHGGARAKGLPGPGFAGCSGAFGSPGSVVIHKFLEHLAAESGPVHVL